MSGLRIILLVFSLTCIMSSPSYGKILQKVPSTPQAEVDGVRLVKVYNRLICTVGTIYSRSPSLTDFKLEYKFYFKDHFVRKAVSSQNNSRIAVPLTANYKDYSCHVRVL